MPTKKRVRGKGEGSVYQRASDGMWVAALELPLGEGGKRRRKVIVRKRKPDVVRELNKAKADLAESGDLITRADISLADWMTRWLDVVEKRPKTMEGYRGITMNHIIPELGKRPLRKLNADHVRQLHRRFKNTPKDPKIRALPKSEWPEDFEPLSSTYALLAHNVLSLALKAAVREGRLRSNPCDMVDRPRARKVVAKTLTVDESIQLLAYCGTIPDGALWATYLLTGARRGEIIAIEKDRVADGIDISWQTQRITDIKSAPPDFEYRKIKGTLYLTRPKSEKGWRVLPLVEPLSTIVLNAAAAADGDFVFTEDGRPWDPDRATKRWKEVLRGAGLPDDVVLHGARHTAVNLLYALGVGEQVVRDIVGHSEVSTTLGYRTRVPQAPLRDAMARLGVLLGGSPNPNILPE